MKGKPLLRFGMEGALTLAADCIAEPHWYLHRSASGILLQKSMKYAAAEIEEARRLVQQAEGQVTAQLEMIDRMKRSGLSTAVAEEPLRMMRNAWTSDRRFLERWSASRERRAICSSFRFRSEMSRAIFEAPIILPSPLLTGETVSEIGTWLPSLRLRLVS
jgi:hypothetical protein